MPEIKLGEITNAYPVERDGVPHLMVEARIDGDVDRFLKELREHGLTIFLNLEPEACGVKGTPSGADAELTCELPRGHEMGKGARAAYHKSGRFRWIGYSRREREAQDAQKEQA